MIEKLVRNLLYKILGTDGYLKLVSRLYIILTNLGFFKSKYPELFYLKKLIKPGFICVDIGANVGYYAVKLSKLTGKKGHVYAIEPVPVFAKVFLNNCKKFALNNVTLYRVALGNEEKEISLVTPLVNGVFRHGLTHIQQNQNNNPQQQAVYKAQMVIPDELFKTIDKIDFLKCDVEGYETVLFPQMMQTLKRTKPIIQIEINSPENIEQLYNLLEPIGYTWHVLKDYTLKPISLQEALAKKHGDFYLKCKP